MKVTLTIPDAQLLSIAATAAMMQGLTLPAEFQKVVETTTEVDITEDLASDPESAIAIQGLALVALGKIIEKCENLHNNESDPQQEAE